MDNLFPPIEVLIETLNVINERLAGKRCTIFVNGNNKIAVRYKASEESYGVFVIEEDGTFQQHE